MKTLNSTTTHIARRPLGSRSGQALTEAVIMLALLGFAWALTSYALFMSNNGIKSAMMARHAAWMKGNGLDSQSQASTLGTQFFDTDYYKFGELSKVTNSDGSTAGGLFSAGSDKWLGYLLTWTPDIRHSQTDFGVDNRGQAQGKPIPFAYVNVEFPFMPETVADDMLKVTTHCEWEQVDETWDSLGGMLSSIMSSL